MDFYNNFISDLLPHRIVLTAARVLFSPSKVVEELSKKSADYKLSQPAAYVVGIVTIMFLSFSIDFRPDISGEWTRAIYKLEHQDIKKIQKCLKISDDINMPAELINARWNPKLSVLNNVVVKSVGSLDVDRIILFVATNCDKSLAEKMLTNYKEATIMDSYYLSDKLNSFSLIAIILCFSAIVHHYAKPHRKKFKESLSFGCYFMGTSFLFFVFFGVLAVFVSPLFLITFFGMAIIFFVLIVRGIMLFYEIKFGKAVWALNLALLNSALAYYVIINSTIWLASFLKGFTRFGT